MIIQCKKEFIVNKCHGGFGLSKAAVDRLLELGYKPPQKVEDAVKAYGEHQRDYWIASNIDRSDPLLVQVVRELQEKASADYASLSIVEFTTHYSVEGRDGYERIEVSGWED